METNKKSEKIYYIKNTFNVYSLENKNVCYKSQKNEYEQHIKLFSKKSLQYLKSQGLIRDI